MSPQQFLAAYFTGAFTVIGILIWQMWRAHRFESPEERFTRELGRLRDERRREEFAAIRERINRGRVR